MKPLVIDDGARGEYLEAIATYLAENVVVAVRFVENVEATLSRIEEQPHIWPLAPRIPEHLRVRRCMVEGFPYSVIFVELPTEIRILAVAHGKRLPGYWVRRVPR